MHLSMEGAVERSSACVPRGDREGTTSRNRRSIPMSFIAAGQRACRGGRSAAYPLGDVRMSPELSAVRAFASLMKRSIAPSRSSPRRSLLIGLALLIAASSPAVAEKEGRASFYGKRFHGKPTASGARFDMHALTAAHRTLSFGTRVKVTNRRNGRSVVVTIP